MSHYAALEYEDIPEDVDASMEPMDALSESGQDDVTSVPDDEEQTNPYWALYNTVLNCTFMVNKSEDIAFKFKSYI